MQTTTEQPPKHSAQAGKYLTFVLGNESYGIEVLKVREIIKMQPITHVVQTPNFIKGVLNLRGKLIPVVDLRVKFGLEDRPATDTTCIIVVNYINPQKVYSQTGVIVDGVEEVLNIALEDIEKAPNFGESVESEYILGMAKIKGVVKTLLDVDKVIGVEIARILDNMPKQRV
jgi:purine-binding chemotaxis protein CheW